MSDPYIRQALRLLQEHHHKSTHTASSSAAPPRSSPSSFTYEEVNAVLGEAVETDQPAALIAAIAAMGADVNYAKRRSASAWKKALGRDQTAVRNNVLQRAAGRSAADTVAALARLADQKTLDGAMRVAAARGDADVVRALLDRGADPEPLAGEQRRRLGVREGENDDDEDDDGGPSGRGRGLWTTLPPRKSMHDDDREAWHQDQLERTLKRTRYKSLEHMSARARRDQERVRREIARVARSRGGSPQERSPTAPEMPVLPVVESPVLGRHHG
jgi:hypothetical protein